MKIASLASLLSFSSSLSFPSLLSSPWLASLVVAAGLLNLAPASHAQTRLAPAPQPAALTRAESSKALASLFAEMWENTLRTSPELASAIGDKRYNDRLDDRSALAYNQNLERESGYLIRLAAIDTAGLSEQEQLSKELMVRQLVEDQQEALFKPWEMPLNQADNIATDLARFVDQLSFTTVKDYDDYIARLKQVPVAFQQTTDNLETGIADRRTPPGYLL
ncbi:MAG TPA: DUF885 family protein, partial [Acidobacteriaceae bacterium]